MITNKTGKYSRLLYRRASRLHLRMRNKTGKSGFIMIYKWRSGRIIEFTYCDCIIKVTKHNKNNYRIESWFHPMVGKNLRELFIGRK